MENKAIESQLASVKKVELISFEDSFEESYPRLSKILPSNIDKERFKGLCLSLYKSNKEIAGCSIFSVLSSLADCAKFGLEPNIGGQCYIIPYNNYKLGIKEAQFQIGYRGLITLFYRHNAGEVLDAGVVYEGDIYDIELGSNPKITHKPMPTPKKERKVIAYYAYAVVNGRTLIEQMTYDDMKEFEKKYITKKKKDGTEYTSNFWLDNFEEMAKKTVIKRLCKRLPYSLEIQKIIDADNVVCDTFLDKENSN